MQSTWTPSADDPEAGFIKKRLDAQVDGEGEVDPSSVPLRHTGHARRGSDKRFSFLEALKNIRGSQRSNALYSDLADHYSRSASDDDEDNDDVFVDSKHRPLSTSEKDESSLPLSDVVIDTNDVEHRIEMPDLLLDGTRDQIRPSEEHVQQRQIFGEMTPEHLSVEDGTEPLLNASSTSEADTKLEQSQITDTQPRPLVQELSKLFQHLEAHFTKLTVILKDCSVASPDDVPPDLSSFLQMTCRSVSDFSKCAAHQEQLPLELPLYKLMLCQKGKQLCHLSLPVFVQLGQHLSALGAELGRLEHLLADSEASEVSMREVMSHLWNLTSHRALLSVRAQIPQPLSGCERTVMLVSMGLYYLVFIAEILLALDYGFTMGVSSSCFVCTVSFLAVSWSVQAIAAVIRHSSTQDHLVGVWQQCLLCLAPSARFRWKVLRRDRIIRRLKARLREEEEVREEVVVRLEIVHKRRVHFEQCVYAVQLQGCLLEALPQLIYQSFLMLSWYHRDLQFVKDTSLLASGIFCVLSSLLSCAWTFAFCFRVLVSPEEIKEVLYSLALFLSKVLSVGARAVPLVLLATVFRSGVFVPFALQALLLLAFLTCCSRSRYGALLSSRLQGAPPSPPSLHHKSLTSLEYQSRTLLQHLSSTSLPSQVNAPVIPLQRNASPPSQQESNSSTTVEVDRPTASLCSCVRRVTGRVICFVDMIAIRYFDPVTLTVGSGSVLGYYYLIALLAADSVSMIVWYSNMPDVMVYRHWVFVGYYVVLVLWYLSDRQLAALSELLTVAMRPFARLFSHQSKK